MRRKNKLSVNTMYSVVFWLLLLVLIVSGMALNVTCRRAPIFNGEKAYQEPQWTFGEKHGEKKPVQLNERQWMEPGKTYMLHTRLTYDPHGDLYASALVSCSNLEVEAFYDYEPRFSFTAKDKTASAAQSVGYTIFPVNLGSYCRGKEFHLELRMPFDHPGYVSLPQVFFGDHATQVRQMFFFCLPSMLISAAIAIAVVILVLLGNTVDGTQWTYVYFSTFAMMVVVYRASQNTFISYMWGSPFMGLMCEYFSIAACPIPILMSYRYRMKPFGERWFNFFIGVSILDLLLQNVLHFTGLRDVTHMVLGTHLWLIACGAFLVAMGLWSRKVNGRSTLFRKLLPILAGSGLDMTYFYLTRFRLIRSLGYLSIGDFTGIGLLISLSIMILEARRAKLVAYQENERNKLLEKAVYTDSLTGICNRAAFSRTVADIESGVYAGRSVRILSADLNLLKETNDNMGHAAGDQLIRQAAQLLEESVEPYGNAYRIGGDEFAAILFDLPEYRWQEIREKILTGGRQETPVSLAFGTAVLENGDVEQCLRLADQRMYEHKEEFHREKPREE